MKGLVSKVTKRRQAAQAIDAERVEDAPVIGATARLNDAGFPAIYLDEPIEIEGTYVAVEIGGDKIRTHDTQTGRGREIPLKAYGSLDESIRVEMARKIARITPSLGQREHDLLLNHAVDTLHKIAKDQTVRVREMLAEEMADMPDAQPDIVRQLAWDEDARVARSVLERSSLLGENELLDLIATAPVEGVVDAIAKRADVSEELSAAIVNTEYDTPIKSLLENQGAHISEDTLEHIVEMAPGHQSWHGALVNRDEVTQATQDRIAEFVSHELLETLQGKAKVSIPLASNAKKALLSRLKTRSVDSARDGLARARRAYKYDMLTPERVDDAIHGLDKPFVIGAIALMAGIDSETVRRVIDSRNAKVITAIAYEAGLSARSAMALQMKIGNVPHMKMLHPRGGMDYPMHPAEMKGFLEIFTG